MNTLYNRIILLALGIFIAASGAAHAAPGDIYYVDPAGNDANPGTEALPWATCQKAASTLTAGETAYFKSGTYSEFYQGLPAIAHKACKPQNSGTATNPIVFSVAPGHEGNVLIDQQHSARAGFFMKGLQYVTIRGFEIIRANHGVETLVDSQSYGIVIENNHIHDLYSTGSNMGGVKLDNCTSCIVRYNTIHDIRQNQGSGTHGQGVHSFSMDQTEIYGNTIYDVQWGVFFKRARSNSVWGVKVYQNVFYDMKTGVNIGISGATNAPYRNLEIYENVVYNSGQGVTVEIQELNDSSSTGIKIWNNVFDVTAYGLNINGMKDVQIWNNIITDPGSFEIRTKLNSGSNPTEITYSDFNLYVSTPQTFVLNHYHSTQRIFNSLSAWTAGTGFDQNSTINTPMFIDQLARDYRLCDSSPAVGSGRNGENIGAFPIGVVGGVNCPPARVQNVIVTPGP